MKRLTFRYSEGFCRPARQLPEETFRWVYDTVSPTVLLQSTSGGTDVVTSFVAGSSMLPVWAGEIAAPALGVHAQAFAADGRPVVNELGELVITTPLPSMSIYFWNDPDEIKYRAACFERFPGAWCHGDWVKFTDRGSCVITGRSDGTLNRGGVRLGTSEFYSALDDFPEMADSLVVHLEDISGGLGTPFLFVQLTDGSLDGRLRAKITACLRDRLSPRHGPDEVVAVPAIPYNLTGKKLEVPVKRLLQGASRGAVVSNGAVRNPDSLDAFEHLAQRLASTTAVGPA